jgi:hypothetical protein
VCLRKLVIGQLEFNLNKAEIKENKIRIIALAYTTNAEFYQNPISSLRDATNRRTDRHHVCFLYSLAVQT